MPGRSVPTVPENEKHCEFCHAILFDDDDVVYCPICGAPHHRECYKQLGHCAREQYHGLESSDNSDHSQVNDGNNGDAARSDSRYGNSSANSTEESSGQGDYAPNDIPRDREGHVCPVCGKISTSDTIFCPYCGTPFGQNRQQNPNPYANPYANRHPNSPFGFNAAPIDPYGGVDPNSSIDGVPVSEMTSFVRVNTSRYIPVFSSLAAKKKKTGWNWASFFFSYGWLFYRKCYREGLVAIIFTIISYVMVAPAYITYYNFFSENYSDLSRIASLSQNEVMNLYQGLIDKMTPLCWILLAAAIVLNIAIRVFIGLRGDWLYMNRAKIKIGQIKDAEQIDDKLSAIIVSGGVNALTGMTIVVAMRYVFNFVIFYLIQ